MTTEWNCPAVASSAGTSLDGKENQINLEQPWLRISGAARMNPSGACSGGWWARDCDPPTFGCRASCPRDAALVLFKYALAKAAFPSQPPRFGAGMGRARGRRHLFPNPYASGREPRSSGKRQSGPQVPQIPPNLSCGAPGVGHGSGSVAWLAEVACLRMDGRWQQTA